MLADKPLSLFLKEVSDKTPAPGGGSVSAVAGALASALFIMVCKYTKDKSVRELIPKFEALQNAFLSNADLDTQAYIMFREARKSSNPEQIQKALEYAIEIPMNVLRDTCSALELAKQMSKVFNMNLRSDFTVAFYLLVCATKGALSTVNANLSELTDNSSREKIADELQKLLSKVEVLENHIQQDIKEREKKT